MFIRTRHIFGLLHIIENVSKTLFQMSLSNKVVIEYAHVVLAQKNCLWATKLAFGDHLQKNLACKPWLEPTLETDPGSGLCEVRRAILSEIDRHTRHEA